MDNRSELVVKLVNQYRTGSAETVRDLVEFVYGDFVVDVKDAVNDLSDAEVDEFLGDLE